MNEYALDLNDVINYIKVGSRSWVKGSELSKSKTRSVFFGIAERQASYIRFEGACLRSTLSKPPFKSMQRRTIISLASTLRRTCQGVNVIFF